jgi:UDP-N-acetylmuramoylalanine--D-glutamate ligase
MSERIAVLGLARSGRAAAQLALRKGAQVYASDAADTPALRAAAAEVRAAGGDAEVGGHDVARLTSSDLIVLSPGIPPTATVLTDHRVAAVPRISELEFAYRELRSPVIAITGTNGKSTTTALTAHLLTTAGFIAPAAGNIGLPLSEVAMRMDAPDWVIVEASSFQLADVDRFAPRIGVVTNLSPDHLDRYPSVEAYYGDKARLFANARADSIWVLNAEDEAVVALPGEADGARLVFRVNTPLETAEQGGWVTAAGDLMVRMHGTETRLLHTSELRLLGQHNQANALAAAVTALSAGADATAVGAGLRSFAGLEHRLEFVAERDGVLWINDSKATNVGAALVALRSMTRPTVLLLGGRHKGESYAPLVGELRRNVRAVVAFGEASPLIERELTREVPVIPVAGSFEDVVCRAAELAQPGEAVLLAPACSSFDMFRDYEERGRRFKELARTVVAHG